MKKSDETQSFEHLYNEIFPVVYRVSYHITGDSGAAEDICQEAFIKYYNRQVPLPTINDAKYWLIRVVKNLSFNYGKREKRKLKVFDKIKNEPAYSDDTGEKEILKKETMETVNRVLEKLPEKLKTPLVLREYSGLNYKEISKVLGISESNVKVRIFRARENIQKMIDKGDIYVP